MDELMDVQYSNFEAESSFGLASYQSNDFIKTKFLMEEYRNNQSLNDNIRYSAQQCEGFLEYRIDKVNLHIVCDKDEHLGQKDNQTYTQTFRKMYEVQYHCSTCDLKIECLFKNVSITYTINSQFQCTFKLTNEQKRKKALFQSIIKQRQQKSLNRIEPPPVLIYYMKIESQTCQKCNQMMKGTLVEEDVEDFSKDFIVKLGTLLKSGQFGKKKKKEHDRCLYFFYDKRSNDN